MGKDYYAVLGVPKNATEDVIKKVSCMPLHSLARAAPSHSRAEMRFSERFIDAACSICALLRGSASQLPIICGTVAVCSRHDGVAEVAGAPLNLHPLMCLLSLLFAVLTLPLRPIANWRFAGTQTRIPPRRRRLRPNSRRSERRMRFSATRRSARSTIRSMD